MEALKQFHGEALTLNAKFVGLALVEQTHIEQGLPMQFPLPSGGELTLKNIQARNIKQFDYVVLPLLGVFNVLNLNEMKFDKTDLCKKIDKILSSSDWRWPIITEL